MVDPFAHAQLIDGQGSRAKIRRGQVVKVVFQRSKILTPVAALDTVPMGVTPPPLELCVHMERAQRRLITIFAECAFNYRAPFALYCFADPAGCRGRLGGGGGLQPPQMVRVTV